MRRLTLLPIVAALALAGVVARAPSAWACSCVSASVSEHFKRADVVFTGLVTSVDAGATSTRTSVAVDAVYKGRTGPTILITSGSPSGAAVRCDVEFVPGQRYTVFATLARSVATTSICAGTTSGARILARAGYTRPRQRFTTFGAPTPVAAAPVRAPVRALPIAVAGVLLAGAVTTLILQRARGRFTRSRSTDGEAPAGPV